MISRRQLDALTGEVRQYAEELGLDFFPTIFEVIDSNRMNEIAGYGGFPNRYPHWSFGMEFERLRRSYEHGLHRISEMVINNNPCYAYLLENNNAAEHKFIVAHVYAHCDFFKNNMWFAGTNRHMIDEMANHASRIRGYAAEYGFNAVEGFLDTCLSIDDLIDPHSLSDARRPSSPGQDAPGGTFAGHPQRDILLFLIEHGRIEQWQRDILSVIREESYYFAPQGQTKIMNEGWATYWHSRMMTDCLLDTDELIDYADHHSSTLASKPGGLNPYKLGCELFRDIEERWNTGERDGIEKLFEIRRIYNDVGFIDAFLTEDFCRRHKLFAIEENPRTGKQVIAEHDFSKIKQKILWNLTNLGRPVITVADGDYRGRGELLLKHRHDGMDLRWDYAKDVLAAIYRIWGRPVTLEATVKNTPTLLSFDGCDHHETEGAETALQNDPADSVPEAIGAA